MLIDGYNTLLTLQHAKKRHFNTLVFLADIQHKIFTYEYSFIIPILIWAEWCMYPAVYWAIIGLDNGWSPVWCQSITRTNYIIAIQFCIIYLTIIPSYNLRLLYCIVVSVTILINIYTQLFIITLNQELISSCLNSVLVLLIILIEGVSAGNNDQKVLMNV